jgi:hypothetical protein
METSSDTIQDWTAAELVPVWLPLPNEVNPLCWAPLFVLPCL